MHNAKGIIIFEILIMVIGDIALIFDEVKTKDKTQIITEG